MIVCVCVSASFSFTEQCVSNFRDERISHYVFSAFLWSGFEYNTASVAYFIHI